jgi:hypothetical protein
MRTILHIGMSKTGTTALQESFARSRAYLATRGVLYPRNPAGSSQRHHQVVACGLAPFERLPREFQSRYADGAAARAAYRAFVAHLRAQVAEARPEALVLSGESMFRALGETGARNLTGLLEGLGDEIRIAAYVRRPSEHVLSHIQQAMRYSHRPRGVESREILPVLDGYAALFGAEAVDARAFHRDVLAGGDVVTDFCARNLAETGVTRAAMAAPGFANESLSAEASDVSRRYRLAFHRGRDRFSPDSRGLLTELAAIDAALGAERPRLRPGLAEAIDHASAEPLALRARYGIEFAGVDYARLARGDFATPPAGKLTLARILEIDLDRERAILEALAGGAWAAEEAARSAWIERENEALTA